MLFKKKCDFKHYWQAIFVSWVKLFALHLMQPILFIVPFLAYSASMGWVQYLCAIVVVLNEVMYIWITTLGLYFNRKYFLHCPFNDARSGLHYPSGPIGYFVMPAVSIYGMLYKYYEGKHSC